MEDKKQSSKKPTIATISTSEVTEGEDFYINDAGLFVFTEAFHLKRGYCCENGCRHCPYNFKKKKSEL
jgi:Family of unknown function (DUF5522)